MIFRRGGCLADAVGTTPGQMDLGRRRRRQLVARGGSVQVPLVRAEPSPERKGAEHAPVPPRAHKESLDPIGPVRGDRPSAFHHQPGFEI